MEDVVPLQEDGWDWGGLPGRGAALHGDGAALLQNGMLRFGLGDAGSSPHVMEGIAARKYF